MSIAYQLVLSLASMPRTSLETPENAKAVLNKAHDAVPTSHEIWIATGRVIEQEASATDILEEKRTEELERVDKMPATAVRALRAHGVLLVRPLIDVHSKTHQRKARSLSTHRSAFCSLEHFSSAQIISDTACIIGCNNAWDR